MVGLRKMLLEEQRRLEEILKTTNEQLQDVPEGKLRLSHRNGYTEFYLCDEENSKNGKYLKKTDSILIRQLAQKSYAQKVQQIAEKRLSQIHKIARDYDDNEIEKIYLAMHSERQKLVEPIATT